MGAPRKYTPKKLREAVETYFSSITREVTLKERVKLEEKDEYGHAIFEERPIRNKLGQPVTVTEYILPPSVEDLCLQLQIHRSTWNDYCNDERYSDTVAYARALMQAYLVRESLTREGKDLKGILFNLENNYGYSQRHQLELGERASKTLAAGSMTLQERKALLEEIAKEYQGGGESSENG